jgi:hypothetical protein
MKAMIVVFLFIIIAPNAFSCGKKEKSSAETIGGSMENTIKILGKIQIYGNEPHTFVGIIDENGTEYAVFPPAKEEELRTLQGYLIEFTVILLDEPQGYGSLFLKGGTVTPIKWEIL